MSRVPPRSHVEFHALHGGIDRRVVEVDFETQLEAVARREPRPFGVFAHALTHFHGAQHAQELLRRILQANAGALQQVNEGRRGAVENGDLLGGHVHVQVVDAEAGTRRHQVLDGAHLDVACGQRGRHARVRHGARVGPDVNRPRQVDAAENNARVHGRRPQREFHALAPVQPDADGAGQRFQGALRNHAAILRKPP